MRRVRRNARVHKTRAFLPLLCVLVIVASSSPVRADAHGYSVVIRGHRIAVELARTVDERARGLGGRDGLARDHGMLFVFESPQSPTFWMLGMRFALDFVWIRGDRIVDLTRDVPPAPPGATEESGLLRTLQPATPADLILEVRAGTIDANHWKTGDAVEVTPKLR